MKKIFLIAATLTVAAVGFAHAQSPGGAAAGAIGGAAVGGAVGGPIGAAAGAATGAAVGGLTGDNRVRFRTYARERGYPSYRYNESLRVGAVLPDTGVTYYDVPPEYGVRNYRYTIVNDSPVLVDPGTRRVIEVIE